MLIRIEFLDFVFVHFALGECGISTAILANINIDSI